jgi:hypothetical protein
MDTQREIWKQSQLQILQELGVPKEQLEAMLTFLLWLHDNEETKVTEALKHLKSQHDESLLVEKGGV